MTTNDTSPRAGLDLDAVEARIAAGFARTDLRAEVAAVGNDAAAVAVGVSRSTLRGWRGRWLR